MGGRQWRYEGPTEGREGRGVEGSQSHTIVITTITIINIIVNNYNIMGGPHMKRGRMND